MAGDHWQQRHTNRCASPKRSVKGEADCPKKAAVGQQQCKANSTKNEVLMKSKVKGQVLRASIA
jgi:hypothetical protein